MQSVGFVLPLLPGKTETDRSVMRSCWQGERKASHQSARERLGITRESVWIQDTPGGDVVVVYMEADDVQAAIEGMASSEEPFDRFFRNHLRDVHGLDLANGFTPPEQVLDFNASS
jgi:hypothetical protein